MCPSDLIIYRNQPIHSQVQEPTSHHPDGLQRPRNYLGSLTAIDDGLGNWSWRDTEGERACWQNWQAGELCQSWWLSCVPGVHQTHLGSRTSDRQQKPHISWAWPTTPFWGQGDWQNASGLDNNGYSVHPAQQPAGPHEVPVILTFPQRSKCDLFHKHVILQALYVHKLHSAMPSVIPKFWTGYSRWTSSFFLVHYDQYFKCLLL